VNGARLPQSVVAGKAKRVIDGQPVE